jgi:hypothetical protein
MPRGLALRVARVDEGAGTDRGARDTSKRLAPDLRVQALRLPREGRALLDALVHDLNGSRSNRSSAGAVTRGLVLLALHCGQGIAGPRLAQAFRLAASDPTEQGVHEALEVLRRADPTDTEPEPTRRSA